MVKPRKVHFAFVVSLIMSLSLFTSGVFARNVDHTLVKSAVVGKIDFKNTNLTSAFTSTTEDINGVTQQFKVGTKMYVVMTFEGDAGYVKGDLYQNGKFYGSRRAAIPAGRHIAVLPITLGTKPGNLLENLYWCTMSDCSDATFVLSVPFSAS